VRSVSLLLLLSCALVLLGPIQCLSRIAVSSRLPSFAGVHDLQTTHTREEVCDRQVDFSRDAQQESAQATEPDEMQSRPRPMLDDPEVEIVPMRRLLHRQVAPSSPDDAFHLA
jgi:hypothetical protein